MRMVYLPLRILNLPTCGLNINNPGKLDDYKIAWLVHALGFSSINGYQ